MWSCKKKVLLNSLDSLDLNLKYSTLKLCSWRFAKCEFASKRTLYDILHYRPIAWKDGDAPLLVEFVKLVEKELRDGGHDQDE